MGLLCESNVLAKRWWELADERNVGGYILGWNDRSWEQWEGWLLLCTSLERDAAVGRSAGIIPTTNEPHAISVLRRQIVILQAPIHFLTLDSAGFQASLIHLSVEQLKVKHGSGQSYTAASEYWNRGAIAHLSLWQSVDNSSLSSTAHPSGSTLSHILSQNVGCHGARNPWAPRIAYCKPYDKRTLTLENDWLIVRALRWSVLCSKFDHLAGNQ